MIVPVIGDRYLFLAPPKIVRDYVIPAKVLVLKRRFPMNIVLLEEVCLADEFLYSLKIHWKFAPLVMNIPAPTIKCADIELLTINEDNISYSISKSVDDMMRLGVQ